MTPTQEPLSLVFKFPNLEKGSKRWWHTHICVFELPLFYGVGPLKKWLDNRSRARWADKIHVPSAVALEITLTAITRAI